MPDLDPYRSQQSFDNQSVLSQQTQANERQIQLLQKDMMNEYSRFNTTKKSIRDKEIYLTQLKQEIVNADLKLKDEKSNYQEILEDLKKREKDLYHRSDMIYYDRQTLLYMKSFRYKDLVTVKKPYLDDYKLDKELQEFLQQRKNILMGYIKELQLINEEFNQAYQKQDEIQYLKGQLEEIKFQKQQDKDEVHQNCQEELDRIAIEKKQKEEYEILQQKLKEQKIQDNLKNHQKEFEKEYQKLVEIESQITRFKKNIAAVNNNQEIYGYLDYIKGSSKDLTQTVQNLEEQIQAEKKEINELTEKVKLQGFVLNGKLINNQQKDLNQEKEQIENHIEIENELQIQQTEQNIKLKKILTQKQMLSYISKQQQVLQTEMKTIFSKNQLLLNELNNSELVQDKNVSWVHMIDFLCKYLYKSVEECQRHFQNQIKKE